MQMQLMQQQQQFLQMGMQQACAPVQSNRMTSLKPASMQSTNCQPSAASKPKSPMEMKHFLLHLLSTDILLGTRLHGDFTAIHSCFDSWSPRLPHSTIRAVLSFYGLSEKWLSFFTTFLEAPLRFTSDGINAETRIRRRGVPGAHALSSICGEAVLFVLDFAVNQETDGALLYRMHDDFWLWSHNHQTIINGWSAITKFASAMGVFLNDRKTGCTRIGSVSQTMHPSLPTGNVRWGFLILDARSGRFIIDQDMVDKHIADLQGQLETKKSVCSYIQAWNAYAGTFFLSNFGSHSNCFGRDHVDAVLNTLRKIQCSLPEGQNIASHIRSMINNRFGVEEIPDGFLYFPTSLGGLGLQNPFVGLIQIRNSVAKSPAALLDRYSENEKAAYTKAKKKWESGALSSKCKTKSSATPEVAEPFMSFEEFTKYREQLHASWDGNLLSVYNDLLRKPNVVPINASTSHPVNTVIEEIVIGAESTDLDYLRWVGTLYGKEMMEKFGGVRIVEKGLLPTGMVELFRSGRMKWHD